MIRFRAVLLLTLFVAAVIGRAIFGAPAENPFSHLGSESAISAAANSGDSRADEVAPLKMAKRKRRIQHAPPLTLVLIRELVYRFQPVDLLYSFAALRTPFSLRLGPDTPPPIARSIARLSV